MPTTVFTPLEMAAIGLTEVEAIASYGQHCIEVSHSCTVRLVEFSALQLVPPFRVSFLFVCLFVTSLVGQWRGEVV